MTASAAKIQNTRTRTLTFTSGQLVSDIQLAHALWRTLSAVAAALLTLAACTFPEHRGSSSRPQVAASTGADFRIVTFHSGDAFLKEMQKHIASTVYEGCDEQHWCYFSIVASFGEEQIWRVFYYDVKPLDLQSLHLKLPDRADVMRRRAESADLNNWRSKANLSPDVDASGTPQKWSGDFREVTFYSKAAFIKELQSRAGHHLYEGFDREYFYVSTMASAKGDYVGERVFRIPRASMSAGELKDVLKQFGSDPPLPYKGVRIREHLQWRKEVRLDDGFPD